MILYFSATGNSKYVAARMAAATNDETVSIIECINKERYSFTLKEGENLGIVCPTYFWGFPSAVNDFFEKMQLNAKNPYIYFIATYGKTPGAFKKMMKKTLQQKEFEICAYYGVQMPDTWTPMFNLSDPEKMNKINGKADRKIQTITKKVAAHAGGDFMTRKLPYVAGRLTNTVIYDQNRKTKHLKLNDACTGCGLCAKKCPVQAIEIKDKKPVWVKDQCMMCLGCLHRCPANAIEYGRSKNHGQYSHPKAKV